MTHIEAALKYAEQGLLVFPLYEVGDGICACLNPDCKSKGKHPRVADGLYKATNNANQIKDWWNRWPNANIGMQTGPVVVLDIDDKVNKRGMDSLTSLGFKIEDFNMVNRTGSGGYHVFFKYAPGDLKNRASMKPGLDLRGAGGYVVLPPSTHASGDVYTEAWNRGLQEIPSQLMTLFREKESKIGRPKAQDPTATSVCQGSRDDYLMSFAGKLRRLGLNNEEISGALHIINKRRCNPPKEEKDVERLATNAYRYEPSAAVTPGGAALNAFIQRSHLIVKSDDAATTVMVDFTTGMSRVIDREVIQSELGESAYKIFRANRIINAQFDYNPAQCKPMFQDEDGLLSFNQYIPPKWKRAAYYFETPIAPEPNIPEVYETFFRHLTAAENESYEYLIDWMANSLQSRNHTMLTAIGAQGIGKGTLGLILQKLHGDKNFAKVRDTVFKEKFNSRLKNKTLVYVDEIDLKTKESQDRIKDVVNAAIEVEGKGENADEVINFGSYYLSSNSMDAVKIEAGDRRFSVIQLTETQLIHSPLMSRVAELMDEGNIDRLARYLLFKVVARDMFTPFRSSRYDMVRSHGLKDWEFYVIDEWCPQFKGHEVALGTLQDAIKEHTGLKSAPGRLLIEELAKKYSDLFQITHPKKAGIKMVRFVKVL